MPNNDIICYYVAGLGSKNNVEEAKTIQSVFLNFKSIHLKYKTHKDSSGFQNILNQLANNLPLQNSNFVYNLAYEIIKDLKFNPNKKVFVLGHSFGGMIVNRTAEIIQTIFYGTPENKQLLNEKINDKIKKNKAKSKNMDINDNNTLSNLISLLEYEYPIIEQTNILKKLQIATFGSIYFAKYTDIDKLTMYNYISSSDNANWCNGLKKYKELPIILKNTYYDLTYSEIQTQPDKPYIIQICLYNVFQGKNFSLSRRSR